MTREQQAILDLASRFDGFMTPFDGTISDMLRDNLITMAYACEGFVIVRAIPKPAQPQPRTVRGSFVRRYLDQRRPRQRQREVEPA